METAQETYRRLVRDYLAPGFRAIGLRGSGNNYLLPDDMYWIGIGLQGSRHSDARRALFTLNMNFVPKSEWDELRANWLGSLPARPSPTTTYPAGLSWRIGAVLEPGETWWIVRGGDVLDELAEEIISIVREGALPWLQHHRADPDYYKHAPEHARPLIRPQIGRFPTDLEL